MCIELNNSLKQIFINITEVKAINNIVIVTTKKTKNQYVALNKGFNVINENKLTLCGSKCIFASQDIQFWGTKFTIGDIRPRLEKQRAFQGMKPPKRKEDVTSFLAMLQSHSKFITLF